MEIIEQNTELPANLTANSLKAFRKYSDIEDFYRFVYENDIRAEAFHMLSVSIEKKRKAKAPK